VKKFLTTLAATVLLSLSSLVAAVPVNADTTSSAPIKTGGTFRWGFSPPDSLNPFVAVNESSIVVDRLTYESLVDYDQNFNYVPYLATSWETSSDGKTWTFHLTDKAMWQDGQPLTSEDVKFTIDYIKKNELGQYASFVDPITDVTTPDKTTVVMKLKQPLATMLYNMRNLIILPEHIWSKMTKAQAMAYSDNPIVGSGPFEFVTWKKGQYLQLQANKNYWRGRPKIDTLILQEVTNPETAVNELKAGQLDGVHDVPPELVPSLQQNKSISVVNMKSFWFDELIINSHLKGTMGNPLLHDRAVQLAIAHAIDKNALVQSIYYGKAQPGVGIISPANAKWFNTNIPQFDFNLAESRKILDDAGYKVGPDGIREKNGKKLIFRFNVMNDASQFRAAQQISAWLKQIGIQANPVQTEDLGSLIYRDNDHNGVVDADFDLMLWDWSGDPDPSFNLMTMITSQIGNWQDAEYSNPVYDNLYNKQENTMDITQRKAIVDQMQQIVYNDLPYVVLYYPNRIQAYRSDKWAGMVPMVDGYISKLNIQSALQVHQITPPASTTSSSGASSLLWLWIVLAVVVLGGGVYVARRRNINSD